MADIRTKSSCVPLERESLDNQFSTGSNETGLNVSEEIKKLLGRLGESRVEPVAYDTAWIARLGHIDRDLAMGALEWLRAHQLPDGSWGAATPLYHHDRVISTLAAIIALTHHGAPEDQPRIRAALPALQHSLKNLDKDAAGRTVAFEMLLPTLVAEAKAIGLTVDDPNNLLHSMLQLRDAKLANAPKGMISRQSTLGFSAEMVGLDGLHLLDLEDLQYQDGSVCVSPAATAFFATYVRPEPTALEYLHRITEQGGAPTITAIEVFERSWTLWDLKHAGVVDETISSLARPHLDALAAAWLPGHGIAMNDNFIVKDGDHTGIVTELLTHDGREPDLDALLRYEEEDHFRCYPLENEISISANIHIFGALRQIGFAVDHPVVNKITNFLEKRRGGEPYWVDKWHSSPYYPTSLAVIVSAGYINPLVEKAVDWIIANQNPDGSWGYFAPTAEETAYSLKALMKWHQQGNYVPRQVLDRGVAWLVEHSAPPYTPLWISKSLYCPTLVVRSAVLSALWQYESEFGALP